MAKGVSQKNPVVEKIEKTAPFKKISGFSGKFRGFFGFNHDLELDLKFLHCVIKIRIPP